MTDEPDNFAKLIAGLDPPMAVVTTASDREQAGCLIGFHAQSSIEPERYVVWLSKANHTYRVGLRAAHFAVHFLTAEDLALAERFGTLTGEDTDKFAGMDVDPDQNGVPRLSVCQNWMSLDRLAILDDGGDHVCLTTRICSAHTDGDFAPLRLASAAHLDPGHGNKERAVQP